MQSTLQKVIESIPLLTLILAIIIENMLPYCGILYTLDKLVLYFWLIYRPSQISFLILTLVYLLLDIIQGWPLGLNPLMAIIFTWTVLAQRHWAIRKPFSIQWLLLTGSLVIYYICLFSASLIIQAKMLNPLIYISFPIGLLIYPILSQYLYLLHSLMYRFRPQGNGKI